MEQTKAYLTVTLDVAEPVEISDFAALFSGMGAQFDRYLADSHPELKGKAQMYVKEVRKGSIVADLVPNIPDLIGYMDNVLIVGGFGSLFSKRIRKLISGQFVENATKPDIAEVGDALKAVANNRDGTMKLESVEYTKEGPRTSLIVKFDTNEAREAERTLDAQKKALDAIEHVDYPRKIMTFERSRKSDAQIDKPTGELVVIEDVSPLPRALIYGSDMVEQAIKHEIRDATDNIYKKAFIVDANARMRAGRVIGYAVTALHQVIDLPDDSPPKLSGPDSL